MAGVSDNENKDIVVSWIDNIQPTTVLDIGAGMGIYSIMAKRAGQHWTALEVFAPYVDMFNLHSRYERIVIADVRYTDFNKLGDFDLTIAADMLEHMAKDEAKDLLNNLFAHSKYILVCFPLVHHDQHAGHEGNTFETHIDHWDFAEMREFLADVSNKEILESIEGGVLGYFLVRGEL